MEFSRRTVLGGAIAALGAAVASSTAGEGQVPRLTSASRRPANEPFGYCLNTSTIRGNNLEIVGVVNAASKAGFHAIEPWKLCGGTCSSSASAIVRSSSYGPSNFRGSVNDYAAAGSFWDTEPAILRRLARAWTSSDLRMQRRLTVAP
jgi:hypothetical protein